jgi:hypothetical protein
MGAGWIRIHDGTIDDQESMGNTNWITKHHHFTIPEVKHGHLVSALMAIANWY